MAAASVLTGPISFFARGADLQVIFNLHGKSRLGFPHSLFQGTPAFVDPADLPFTAKPPPLSASARKVASFLAAFDLLSPL